MLYYQRLYIKIYKLNLQLMRFEEKIIQILYIIMRRVVYFQKFYLKQEKTEIFNNLQSTQINIYNQIFNLFNNYFILFSMQFCREQPLANSAQCCLFNNSNQIYKNGETGKITKDGLIGIDRNKNDMKLKIGGTKFDNSLKNYKQEANQEKVSLSKLSARRQTYSRDHCYQKQQILNIGTSHVSSSKIRGGQNSIKNSPTFVSLSFNQPKIQTLNLKAIRNINLQQQVQVHQANTYSNRISNPILQSYPVASNQPAYQHNFRFQQPLKGEFQAPKPISIKISPAINKITPRQASQKNQIPQVIKQEPLLINSIKITNNNLNNSQHDNMNGGKTLAPTVQTDRDKNMKYSQVKSGKISVADRLNGSHARNNSQFLARQESQIAHSRLTETLSPDLGRTNLKTVQSIYGSQAQTKRQINQSVILIDFFNPSQNLRRQIQNKIQNRHCAEFNH